MVKKIIVLAVMAVNFLYAVELPISNKYEISIENGEFTVFDFPFKIKKTFSSGFLIKNDSEKIKELKEEDSKVVIDPRTKQPIVKKSKIIQIKQGKKSITFLPKARGSFKIIVWGYKKYPLMFDIKVIDKLENKKSEIQYYYKFLDYDAKKDEAKEFETGPHEKVIVKLLRSIYNKKLPSGYENTRYQKEFDDGILHYTLNFSYIGKAYTAEEWLIQNLTGKTLKLYEEQFSKKNVYAVAFENDLLLKDATTRLFIIRKSTKGNY